MYTTTDFRNGLKIEFEGDPYTIVYFQHVKPGKGGAFVRTKLKNLKTGAVLEHTFRSGDKVEKPDLDEREMQFMYREGDAFHFMDTASYEQIYLDADHMGEAANYMIENLSVKILFFRGEPIGIDLPIFIVLAIRITSYNVCYTKLLRKAAGRGFPRSTPPAPAMPTCPES